MPKTKTVRAKKGHVVKAAAPKVVHFTQTVKGSTTLLVLAVLALILVVMASNLI